MELADLVYEKRPEKLFKRLISIYQLSQREIDSIKRFQETRNLAISYETSSGTGLQGSKDRERGEKMVQESSRVFEPIIRQLFIPQGFEGYIPMVFYGDELNVSLKGPNLELMSVENKPVNLEPGFWITNPREGIIEVESHLSMAGDSRSYDHYLPILADAYNRMTKGRADGREMPRIIMPGGVLEVGEAMLVKMAADLLKEMCKKHFPIERLHDLCTLKTEADYECGEEDGRKNIIVRTLREGYDRLIDRCLRRNN